jgi:hypothetical protein
VKVAGAEESEFSEGKYKSERERDAANKDSSGESVNNDE